MKRERRYDTDDRETLRVLKMQQGDLSRLQEASDEHRHQMDELEQRLATLRCRAAAMAETSGAEQPVTPHRPTTTKTAYKERMRLEEVPEWDSLVQRANNEESGTVDVEELLTAKEIKMAEERVQQIEAEFARRTGLNAADQAFLTIATALQLTRWLMMPRLISTIGKTARLMALLSPATKGLIEHKPETAVTVVDDEVNNSTYDHPFTNDALNWLFGIINSITGTRTLSDFTTIDTATGETVRMDTILTQALRNIKEDWLCLPAAVYAQYARQQSMAAPGDDTLQPLANSFSPDLIGDLYTSQFTQLAAIDSLTIVGQQAAVPLVINMVVGLMHGFLYDPGKDGPREYYDARTRKILIASNALATTCNLTLVASSQNWAKMDVGGLIVAGLRIAQDATSIATLKDKFMEQEMNKDIEAELRHIDSHFINLPAPA